MSDDYVCEGCGKEYVSRSGLYKHRLKCPDVQRTDGNDDLDILDDSDFMEGEGSPTQPEPSASEDDWLDFSFDGDDDSATVRLPPVLKAVSRREAKPKKKMTKAEQKIQADTNLAILKGALTGVDALITKYGRAVMLDDDYECVHSDADKSLVARAQWEYLKGQGLDLSTYLSTGGVALAMTGWYVVPPVLEINKKRERTLTGKVGKVAGSLMSRIPIVGRLFKKKQSDPQPLPSEE